MGGSEENHAPSANPHRVIVPGSVDSEPLSLHGPSTTAPVSPVSSSNLINANSSMQAANPMRRSSSQQLLSASTELMKIATYPALRTVVGAAGVMGWASGLKPRRSSASSPEVCDLVKEPSYCHVELMAPARTQERLNVDSNTSLGSLQQLVQVKTGLPPSRQTLVISEDRARRYGFTDSVWRAKTQLSTARQDMRAFFISSINFIFLPESLNRELNGRGWISSLKSTNWYQSLLEAQTSCAIKAAESQEAPANAAKFRVEQLSGQVLVFEANLTSSLQDLRTAVQEKLGIMTEQQRLIVVEKQEAGPLTYATNTVLLHLFKGIKLGMGAAAKLTSTLLSRTEATFPVTLHTTAGRQLVVTITGEATINDLRQMLGSKEGATRGEDIIEISLPPNLPSLHAEETKSQIIRTVVM